MARHDVLEANEDAATELRQVVRLEDRLLASRRTVLDRDTVGEHPRGEPARGTAGWAAVVGGALEPQPASAPAAIVATAVMRGPVMVCATAAGSVSSGANLAAARRDRVNNL